MGIVSRRWIVLPLFLGACDGSPRSESIARSSMPLVVGAELPISFSGYVNDEDTGYGQVACNDDGRCLGAWQQAYDGKEYIVARRFGSAGPIDARVIFLAGGTTMGFYVRAGARSSGDYLVGWSDPTLGNVVARIDSATGSVLDDPPLPIGGSNSLVNIVGVGDTYVVAYRPQTPISGLRVARVRDGVVLDPSGIDLGTVSGDVTLGRGPGQAVIASTTGIVRLDVASGAVLDSTPIPYSSYAVGAPPGIAFDGTNYVLVWGSWGSTHRSHALRVRASDGAILDPHDDFNGINGGRVIATGTGAMYRAFFDGSNVLAFWSESNRFVGARLTTLGERVQGAPTTAYEYALANHAADSVDFRAGFGLAAWRQDWEGIEGSSLRAASGAAPLANPLSLSYEGGVQYGHTAASNGRDFFVAYMDHEQDHIAAASVDGATGVATGPIIVAPFTTNTIVGGVHSAWTGSAYYVRWHADGTNYLRVVSCDGLPGAGPIPNVTGLMNCNGERCVLVARDSSWITARRMSATNASFIDATPIQIHQDSASPIAVAADTEPAPALRTFLIVFVQGGQVLARRFRADTGSVLPVTTLDTASALGNVAATSDSRQFYVTWIRNGRLVGTLVDAFTGLPTLAQPVDLGEGVAAGSLVFDGTSFVPVWYTNSGLRATRVSTSGALLEGESPVAQAYSPQTTAAAATRFGRTLAVFPVVEIENFSNAVHGRFLDNEAGPGLSARPAQVCSGGAGGAGGTGGVGGTGMAGAAGSAGASGGGLGGAAGFGGGTSGAGNGGAGGAGATAGGAGMTAGSTGLAGSGGAAGSAGATGGVAGGAGAPGEGGEGGEAGGPDEPDGGTSSAGTAGLGGLSGASGLGGYAATAGASSAGAASGANGTTGKVASDDDAGCGCRTPPKHRRPGLLAPVLAALFVLTRHRRRRTGRRTAA